MYIYHPSFKNSQTHFLFEQITYQATHLHIPSLVVSPLVHIWLCTAVCWFQSLIPKNLFHSKPLILKPERILWEWKTYSGPIPCWHQVLLWVWSFILEQTQEASWIPPLQGQRSVLHSQHLGSFNLSLNAQILACLTNINSQTNYWQKSFAKK